MLLLFIYTTFWAPCWAPNIVSIRVNRIEESVFNSLIHIYNVLGPMLGAKYCSNKGQQDRGICF